MSRFAALRNRFARREAPEKIQSRAGLEAARLSRAWRLNRDMFDERVADLVFRCRVAQDAEHLVATLAELRELDAVAARNAARLLVDA